MTRNSLTLTFTQKEHAFFIKRAGKKTIRELLKHDINKALQGIEVIENTECCGDDKRILLPVEFTLRTWKILKCVSTKLGITPAQLVYRVTIAPYLLEIIKEDSLVAEVKSVD